MRNRGTLDFAQKRHVADSMQNGRAKQHQASHRCEPASGFHSSCLPAIGLGWEIAGRLYNERPWPEDAANFCKDLLGYRVAVSERRTALVVISGSVEPSSFTKAKTSVWEFDVMSSNVSRNFSLLPSIVSS